MNKIIQGKNLVSNYNEKSDFKIACCMLKEEISI